MNIHIQQKCVNLDYIKTMTTTHFNGHFHWTEHSLRKGERGEGGSDVPASDNGEYGKGLQDCRIVKCDLAKKQV